MGTFVLMLLAGVLGAGLAVAGTEGRSEIEVAARSMLGLVLGQAVVIGWASAMSGTSDPSSGRWSRRRAALFGVLSMLLAYPVLASVGNIAVGVESMWRGGEADPVAHGTLRLLIDSGGLLASGWSLTVVLLVVTGIPICEEFAYRGLLQRVFVALFAGGTETATIATRWAGLGLASILFSAMHLSALPEGTRGSSLLLLFAVSIVLGWLYERTGRLVAPIAGHAVFNAINLGVATASI